MSRSRSNNNHTQVIYKAKCPIHSLARRRPDRTSGPLGTWNDDSKHFQWRRDEMRKYFLEIHPLMRPHTFEFHPWRSKIEFPGRYSETDGEKKRFVVTDAKVLFLKISSRKKNKRPRWGRPNSAKDRELNPRKTPCGIDSRIYYLRFWIPFYFSVRKQLSTRYPVSISNCSIVSESILDRVEVFFLII